jgi:subtilisin family serine protease
MLKVAIYKDKANHTFKSNNKKRFIIINSTFFFLIGAWAMGVNGSGSVICIVDDGIEYTHPDLADNYRADGSYDFNYGGNKIV